MCYICYSCWPVRQGGLTTPLTHYRVLSILFVTFQNLSTGTYC